MAAALHQVSPQAIDGQLAVGAGAFLKDRIEPVDLARTAQRFCIRRDQRTQRLQHRFDAQRIVAGFADELGLRAQTLRALAILVSVPENPSKNK